ncbi:MAG: beta-galactosidase [Planktomarina sp.]|nr:beta-galactosidase [Planktomarina sp.]|tara:strand:- start:6073 stop:7953 length:1881 start_codon:yes stop_codon:yes gene_type:complete
MKRTLGVCYYPEHWAETVWASDAKRMVDSGLSWVRIGEFSWAKIEPEPGKFEWEWLDRAIETLGSSGLQIVLGTPTATPPRWMLDKHPDMLAHNSSGIIRKFGSRRHYCFSHGGYREEARRITRLMAERYGKEPNIAAWQTDNEYDCHDTATSYSQNALKAFQDWCAQRYQSPDALNSAWGNVFWSMEYNSFNQIELPNQTVTEPNPSHVLAFRRFTSDQVVLFNRVQCDEIRKHSNAPIIHNFMGRITSFDHYDVGADLDISSWDSYPLGFLLDRVGASANDKVHFLRQGDPDFQAFHHDLYRSTSTGRWWVMEQQPGPVNWAPWNPAPLPGMPRLWTLEAFAHGAETVCYFRWRQAPFAQEQMHAGLLQTDSKAAPALDDVTQVANELKKFQNVGTTKAQVALIFDYDSAYAWEAQPQGEDFDYFNLVFDCYRALRRAGWSVDVVPKTVDPTTYKITFAPGLLTVPTTLKGGLIVAGPRAGSKTEELTISTESNPGIPGLKTKITYVESLPPFAPMTLSGGGAFEKWREAIETQDRVILQLEGGEPAAIRAGDIIYLAGWPDPSAWRRLLVKLAQEKNLPIMDLPKEIRIRDTETHRFWFNYGPNEVTCNNITLPAAGVHWEVL